MENITERKKLFELGHVVATNGFLRACANAQLDAKTIAHGLILRHQDGDWGDVSEYDRLKNLSAIISGTRILSSYHVDYIGKVWCITDAADDEGVRHATTFLLPEEY